jgi:DNA (cytosine-5)-methyltransferase 1
MQEGRRIRYPDLPEELRTHKNVSSFVDRFKVVNEKGLSHSMVAHISNDGHYYIHPNPEHPRSLTVREAARVQSFPDNYIFEGSRGAKFTQIGNAVPPLMAKGIAEKLLECL